MKIINDFKILNKFYYKIRKNITTSFKKSIKMHFILYVVGSVLKDVNIFLIIFYQHFNDVIISLKRLSNTLKIIVIK